MTVLLLALISAPQQPPAVPQCPGQTTFEVNRCALADVARAEDRMERYLKAARRRMIEERRSELSALIDAGQTAWKAYSTVECGAVFERWRAGTVRVSMESDCRRRLTDMRAHAIWQNWLTYPDSTPPTLPEPGPTPDSNDAGSEN